MLQTKYDKINSYNLEPDKNGQVKAPEAPGLGIDVNVEGLTNYLVDVSIEVNGRNLYQTPKF